MQKTREYESYFWFVRWKKQWRRLKRSVFIGYPVMIMSIFVLNNKSHGVGDLVAYSVAFIFAVLIFPDVILFLKGSSRLHLDPK